MCDVTLVCIQNLRALQCAATLAWQLTCYISRICPQVSEQNVPCFRCNKICLFSEVTAHGGHPRGFTVSWKPGQCWILRIRSKKKSNKKQQNPVKTLKCKWSHVRHVSVHFHSNRFSMKAHLLCQEGTWGSQQQCLYAGEAQFNFNAALNHCACSTNRNSGFLIVLPHQGRKQTRLLAHFKRSRVHPLAFMAMGKMPFTS